MEGDSEYKSHRKSRMSCGTYRLTKTWKPSHPKKQDSGVGQLKMTERFEPNCLEQYQDVFWDSLLQRLCHFPVHSDAAACSMFWPPEGKACEPSHSGRFLSPETDIEAEKDITDTARDTFFWNGPVPCWRGKQEGGRHLIWER